MNPRIEGVTAIEHDPPESRSRPETHAGQAKEPPEDRCARHFGHGLAVIPGRANWREPKIQRSACHGHRLSPNVP